VAVTAGGAHLCVWDLLSGRVLARLANHQKTVTCVAVSPLAGPASSAAPRLLAGSLDRHVKVYELDAFKVRAWLPEQRRRRQC
jgi:U3 small nucleolar RNA-associated protein 15